MPETTATDDYMTSIATAYEATRDALLAIPNPKRDLIQKTRFALDALREVLRTMESEQLRLAQSEAVVAHLAG